MKRSHSRKSSRWVTVLLVLVLVAGVGIMAYPSFSNWYNGLHQSRAIVDYNQTVSTNEDAHNEALWDAAVAYNEALARTGVDFRLSQYNAAYTDGEETASADAGNGATAAGETAADADSSNDTGADRGAAEGAAENVGGDAELAAARAEYEAVLDVSGTGIMGYIDIDKVNIHLPIYHDTSESVLQIAVGHIAGTSLPVGGASSHCVLTGHTGLPSARLFTDIDQLEEGDTFRIVVLDHTMTYEVDDIRVVLPNEVDSLQIEEGKDLVTLVTCTPYGINTHRLLVTGHRVATPAANTLDQQTPPSQNWQAEERSLILRQIVVPFGISALVTVVILLIVHSIVKRHRRSGESSLPENADVKTGTSEAASAGGRRSPTEACDSVNSDIPIEHLIGDSAKPAKRFGDETPISIEHLAEDEGINSAEPLVNGDAIGIEHLSDGQNREQQQTPARQEAEEDDWAFAEDFDPDEEARRLSFLQLPYPDLMTPEESWAFAEDFDPEEEARRLSFLQLPYPDLMTSEERKRNLHTSNAGTGQSQFGQEWNSSASAQKTGKKFLTDEDVTGEEEEIQIVTEETARLQVIHLDDPDEPEQ